MKSVIFDLGGVVLDWSPDRILEGHYADPEVRALVRVALFQHPDWLQLDRGTLTEVEALRRLAARTGRSPAEFEGLFDAVRSSLQLKPETVELMERLANRGVPLYCLSNMASTTYEYLRDRHAFWSVFQGVVISGEIKMLKPEPEIFEFLLRRYGLAATRTAFVDDHAPNVRAARELGLHAIWFRDARKCEIELEDFLASD